ncbi:MAG: tetratricopeptide repeat protein [bacterium]
MQKIILSILICVISFTQVKSQIINDKFINGKTYLNVGEYARAYEVFISLYKDPNIDNNNKASSYFYSAECLIGLKEFDGALAILEDFHTKFSTSTLRETALYRLGTIYYQQHSYLKSRDRLKKLISDYPNSEFLGSSLYWIGKAYFAENKFSEAEEFLNDAISVGKKNNFIDYAIYTLANLYEENNDYSNAVTYYDELLAYHKDSKLAPNAQYRIGVCYFKLKEYDSVILELTDPLINKLPENLLMEAQYILANSFFRLKDYKNASETYNEILNKNPESEQSDKLKYGLGWVYFQMQNYDEAYKIFNRLSQIGSDTIVVNSLFWSGECRRYQGQEDAALVIYDRFMSKYPKSKIAPMVIYHIGIIYYNKSDYAKAEEYLLKSANSKDNTTTAKAFTLLGEIKLSNKNYKEAIEFYTNAMQTTKIPDNLRNRAILGYGMANYYLNNFDDAIRDLTDLSIRVPKFERDKVNFYLAESHFASGNFSEALKYYNNIEGSDVDIERETFYGRAYSYFNLKDFANSAYYFGEFINKYPKSPDVVDAKFRLADSYYGTKNFEKASELYTEAFKKNKNAKITDFAYYQYGQSLFKSKKWREAIEKFKTLQDKFPRSKFNDDSQYLIGWIYFQKGYFNDAIFNYQEILTKYPGSSITPIAYYSLGDCYYNLGSYDTSITYYNKILSDYSKTQYVFDAINGLQYCYMALEEPEKAIAAIEQYIQINPSSEFGDKILFKKGDIYFNIGKYDAARVSFKEFIATYPSSPLVPSAYYWIGKCSANLKQEDNALYHYNLIVTNYLSSEVGISSVLEMGKLYSKKNEYEKAIELYNTAIKKLPDSDKIPELLFVKAQANVELLEMQAAYETFNQIITYHDGSIFAAKSKIEVGILEMNRGAYENAESLFKELGQIRTDDIGAQAQYYYGLTLFNQNKINDAISALVRVRSVFASYDEWYGKSLLKLGDCYVKIKDNRKARDMYNSVAKKHKNDELGKEANKKLNRL